MASVNLIEATKVYCSMIFNHVCRCLLCGQTQRSPVCPLCLAMLARLDGPLCRCGLPHPAGDPGNPLPAPLCGRCLKRPPSFTVSQAPLHYRFPLDHLIRRYKYRGDLVAERGIEKLLEDGHTLPLARDGCPVPPARALVPSLVAGV